MIRPNTMAKVIYMMHWMTKKVADIKKIIDISTFYDCRLLCDRNRKQQQSRSVHW